MEIIINGKQKHNKIYKPESLFFEKTPLRYHCTLVRMALINKSTDNKCQRGEKGTLVHGWWECRLVQPL